MMRALITALVLSLGACTAPDELYCQSHSECGDAPEGRTFCDVTGEIGGVGHTCVAPPWDASTGPDGATDAGSTGPDGCVAMPETCNGIDDDCDGDTDEISECSCVPDTTEPCGVDTGACEPGIRTCGADGHWGECLGGTGPVQETCNNEDDDCNGVLDNDVVMTCGTDVGACMTGTSTCAAGGWEPCVGAVEPVTESCNDVDDDCDGLVDEGLIQACGSDVGECVSGTQTCSGGGWGACEGSVGPQPEACNGLDDDCDDAYDEGCPCVDGTTDACGTDTGACVAGTHTCTAGAWGPCGGETGPSPEVCNDTDDDCDGMTDEGLTQSCGTDVGACVSGTETCSGGSWGSCVGSVGPVAESCNDIDDDCDWMIDEDDPGGGGACSTGAPGVCAAGTYHCLGGSVICQADATPSAELCDSLDNDCDGLTDETFTLGVACDGGDGDLCTEGVIACNMAGTGTICTDTTGNSVEICNLADDDCDGMTDEGCPATPDLLAPVNGAFTGSVYATTALRPTFRWIPAAGATSYEIELEKDCPVEGFTACAFVAPEYTGTAVVGTSWQPASALAVAVAPPVGRRYFWRVRACNAVGCSEWSAIRYVNVGRQETDYNGDGFGDRLVGAPTRSNPETAEGNAYLYWGKSSWAPAAIVGVPDVTLDNPLDQNMSFFGWSAASVGDVNGDGYSDFVVGARNQSNPEPAEGAAYLFLGRAVWTASVASADAVLDNPRDAIGTGDGFGSSVSGGGDLNADGYSDVIVGAEYADYPETDEGVAYVYMGRVSWPAAVETADIVVDNPLDQPSARFGTVACGGDLNGDGRADLAIGARSADLPETGEGVAFVYFGDATWGAAPLVVEDAPVQLDNPADEISGEFGYSLGGWGDVNTDGFADLVIGAPGNGTDGAAFLYLGRSAWTSSIETSDTALMIPGGESVANSGDVNADGFADVAIGAKEYTNSDTAMSTSGEGHVFLVLGRPSWPPMLSMYDVAIDDPGDEWQAYLGTSVSLAADMNGDGLADVAAGAPRQDRPEENEGNVFMWFGRASWPATIATDVTFDGPDAVGANFGHAMF